MENIICIDLINSDLSKLNDLADLFSISVEPLILNKRAGFARLWIDPVSGILIAYSIKSNPLAIVMSNIFKDSLVSIEPYSIVKPIEKVELNSDKILDKISKTGIKSLLKEEVEYLKSLSNK